MTRSYLLKITLSLFPLVLTATELTRLEKKLMRGALKKVENRTSTT